ncbi:MAG TPA: C40 family peptidase [Mycobacteriales bacterium]|nr:C40 family peptidase [Mycobacteriales bacterium]
MIRAKAAGLRRHPSRRLIALSGLVAAGMAATAVITSPFANATTIGDARAQAAALAASVDKLQTQAEVAAERYDQAESQLSQAVAAQQQADQALDAVQAGAAEAQQALVDRTRALYESGGGPALLATMLSGEDPVDAIDRYHLASAVIGYEARSAAAAASTVASAEALDKRDAAITSKVIRLQARATQATSAVELALRTERSELASASATVLQLEKADEQQQTEQGATEFADAVTADGGTVGDGPQQPTNAVAAAAIAWARTRLGDPYVWGGSGPNVFDCSGLVQWAYAHAGVTLPRVAADQYYAGPHPTWAELEPGDLLFWAYDMNNPASIHHVTIYIGGGLMIAAPHTGTDVQIEPVYFDGLYGATRPWASTIEPPTTPTPKPTATASATPTTATTPSA